MKMNTFKRKIILIALSCILLSLGVNSSNGKNKNRNNNKQDFRIRPNVNDINSHFQKVVKPYIDSPFIPTEVESLGEKKRPNYDKISMSNALLIGKKASTGRKEIEVK